MALPCFAGQGGGGPFASRQGEIRGETVSADRLALATLYLALMSDLMLTRLGVAAGDLIVEGSLAANPAYAALLAAFRPSQQVFPGSDAAGTARGAAHLAKWQPRNLRPPQLIAAPPCTMEGLHAYRSVWTKAVLER
jgi:sugar (pentulose or hexulose) kinase